MEDLVGGGEPPELAPHELEQDEPNCMPSAQMNRTPSPKQKETRAG